MTSGAPDGTKGAPPLVPKFGPLAWIWALSCLVALVNATSVLMEMGRSGRTMPAWHPFVWEFSSMLVIAALAPAIREGVIRFPIRQENLVPALAIHAVLTIPYSLLHIGAMVGLRKLAYALAGSFYEFSHGRLLIEIVYEYRKDVITYAILAGVFWLIQWRAEAAAARQTASPERIEIRDGATVAYLQPADVALVEAAGNYVEFHTRSGVRLVRGTLAAWEAKLTPSGFLRVHRTRLVNRARIAAFAPTASGDVTITMDDGREIAGSRRYRAALAGAPPRSASPPRPGR
ncbi:MAG: LytTR family transcriptional regulator [Hyphomonadaceae bacterium]|nr:LytTR family transcriptional regulator [Hyphomonadaceae bacterium]